MTPIAKTIAAALLAAPLATPAAAQMESERATMLERLEIRSAVTDAMIDLYGSGEVVEDDAADDPMQNDAAVSLVSGEPIPEGVELQPVPEQVAAVLPMVDGAEWMRLGDHLVAVQDGVAEVIVWEVLP